MMSNWNIIEQFIALAAVILLEAIIIFFYTLNAKTFKILISFNLFVFCAKKNSVPAVRKNEHRLWTFGNLLARRSKIHLMMDKFFSCELKNKINGHLNAL